MSATFSLKRNRIRVSSLDLLSTKSKRSSHDVIRQKSEVKRISSHVNFFRKKISRGFISTALDRVYLP